MISSTCGDHYSGGADSPGTLSVGQPYGELVVNIPDRSSRTILNQGRIYALKKLDETVAVLLRN